MAFKLIYQSGQEEDKKDKENEENTNNQTPYINLLAGRIYKTDVAAVGIEYKVGDSLYISNGQLTNKETDSDGVEIGKISLVQEDGLSFVCL